MKIKPTNRHNIPFLILILAAMSASGLLLVTAAAQESGHETPLPQLTQAFNQVQQADRALAKAKSQNDMQAIQNAQHQHQAAQEQMQQSLAMTAGVNPELVAEMQAAGMGWGQICQELGLNPALMGMAQNQHQIQHQIRNQERNRDRSREHMEATSRQMQTHTASKHGMAAMSSGGKDFGGSKSTHQGVHHSSHDVAGASHSISGSSSHGGSMGSHGGDSSGSGSGSSGGHGGDSGGMGGTGGGSGGGMGGWT
jgi:hypothetical protein